MKLVPAIELALLVGMTAVLGCGTSEEQQAIAAIQEAGGKTSTDGQGNIVSVDLKETQANDYVLMLVRSLPHVHNINCTNAQAIKGHSLAELTELRELQTLYLVGTGLDDAGLACVGRLTGLRTLHLGRTKISDPALAAI